MNSTREVDQCTFPGLLNPLGALPFSVVMLGLGLPMHSYALWKIWSGGPETRMSEFYSISLSLCEICSCLSCACYLILQNLCERCAVLAKLSMAGFAGLGRPLFHCCVCLELYVAVIHPVLFLAYKTLRNRARGCVAAWSLTLACCVGLLLESRPRCSIMFTYVLPCCVLVIVLVMVFCCLSVLWGLKRAGPGEGDRQRADANHVKTRAFKVILTVTVLTVFTYLPCVIILALGYVLHGENSVVSFETMLNVAFSVTMVTALHKPLSLLAKAWNLSCWARVQRATG